MLNLISFTRYKNTFIATYIIRGPYLMLGNMYIKDLKNKDILLLKLL